jgi:hypothetical protein
MPNSSDELTQTPQPRDSAKVVSAPPMLLFANSNSHAASFVMDRRRRRTHPPARPSLRVQNPCRCQRADAAVQLRAAEAGGAAAARGAAAASFRAKRGSLSSQGGAQGGERPRPSALFFSDLRERGGAFTELNCELARFAKCSEQLREATYLAKSTAPLYKKNGAHISLYLIHRALLLLPSPPPSFLPPLSFSPLFVHLRCP